MKRTMTTTTTKTRSGLAQTLLAAAALLGLSLLILFANGCGRAPADPAATAAQTLEERESAIAVAEREITLAEREAAVAEREMRLQDRAILTSANRTVYSDRAMDRPVRVPQVVDVFDPIEPAAPIVRAPERRSTVEPAVYRRAYESVTVPTGTTLDLELLDSLSSATTQAGTPFEARVASDVYAGGQLVIPAGARVSGTVAEAVGLRKIGGRSKLALDFDRIELASGRTAAMNGSYIQLGRRETARDAATIGGSAAAGAILGNQVNGRHHDRAKVLGAILGAGVGTAIAHRTNGGEIVLPAGTQLAISLDAPIHVGDRA